MHSREQLLAFLDRAFDGRSWHGPNLLGAIRGLTPAEAFFRPGAGRHSAYDLVLHAAYWKVVARRRLTGERRGSFPLKGSNFFLPPKGKDARALREARAILEEAHRALVAVVESLPGEAFVERCGRWTAEEVVAGVAAHDLYHAGQVRLLKKLCANGRETRRLRRTRPATAGRTAR